MTILSPHGDSGGNGVAEREREIGHVGERSRINFNPSPLLEVRVLRKEAVADEVSTKVGADIFHPRLLLALCDQCTALFVFISKSVTSERSMEAQGADCGVVEKRLQHNVGRLLEVSWWR